MQAEPPRSSAEGPRPPAGDRPADLRGRVRALFAEARRRHVVKVGLAYAGVVLLVVEGASLFAGALDLPSWTVTLVAVLAILGLPLTLALAWVYDLTATGVRRTSPAGAGADAAEESGRAPAEERRRWRGVQDVFQAALEEGPEERERLLAAADDDAPGIRAEVEALLAAHEADGPVDRLSREVVEPALAPLRPGGLAPGERVLHYRLAERMGGGGMGDVYRAHDERLDRVVALKFLPRHLGADPVAKRRFLAEAQAAAALEHPNVCTIHEIGECDGRLYMVMPFYDGESLDRRLARGPLPVAEALDVARQAARGLARAHERGVVHRDVKPANLVVTAAGVVKIVDFGIAKSPELSLTADGHVVGTVAYMSPEQARGEDLDHRSDLWSLGVVLYELLTGTRPFAGPDPRATTLAILESEPAPVSTVRSGLPPALDVVVGRMLEKDRARRPPTAEAVITELDALAGRQVVASSATGTSEAMPATLPSEGERRQATLLAGRVEGYADLVERLPPGELDDTLARVRRRVGVAVSRHGGVLNGFAGARFTAVFGVPTTHEDDAERAVAAGLEILAPAGDIGLRVGVASGVVLARPSGDGDAPFRLAGPAIDAAERLAAEADPGSLLLSPESRRLVERAFETTAAGELALVPDSDTAVAVHRVTGARRGAPALPAGERASFTPYAGRRGEVQALRGHLDACGTGDGRLVVVLGEAGAGKSRLLLEFLRTVPDDVRVVGGRCQAQGGATPYQPFADALRDLLGLGPGSEPEGEDPSEHVARRLAELAPELRSFLPLYLNLLGIGSERHALPRHLRGAHFRTGIREALAAAFTHGGAGGRRVLVLEDWHWVDESSHDVLLQITEMLPDTRLLVLVTCRPGYGVEWTSDVPHAPLFLGPLDDDACRSIARSVLGAREVDDDLGRLLAERAGGNPFFIEELCHGLGEEKTVQVVDGRAVLAEPAGSVHLPDTVQGVIRTRLDRLPADVRDLLRVAAVIGREFSLPVLAEAIPAGTPPGGSLDTLRRLGLLRQVRVVPEPAYRFKHVLTQEVVYDTLLQHQRAALHGRVGAAIERVHAGQLEERADRLTHHFSCAEDWARAIRYGRMHAARAEALSEPTEALEVLERVEAWIGRLPDSRYGEGFLIKVLLDQERLCESMGLRDRQQEILDRLRERLEDRGDERLRCEVHRRQGDVFTLTGRFEAARDELVRALELARGLGDRDLEREVARSLGLSEWHGGRPAEALRWAEHALHLADREAEDDTLITDLLNVSQVLKELGRLDEALSRVEEARRVSDRLGDVVHRSYVLHIAANVHRVRGELDEAVELYEEAIRFARESRALELAFHLTSVATIRLQQGDVEAALALNLEAVANGRRTRNADGLSHALRMAGELLFQLGRFDEALPLLEDAAPILGRMGRSDLESRTWALVAQARMRTGAPLPAVAAWTRVRELRQAAGDAVGELEATEGLAEAIRAGSGEGAASLPHWHDALKLARALGDTAREARIRNTLGIIAWRSGAWDEALGHYRRALELARADADPGREGLLLNSVAVTLRSLGRREEAARTLDEALEVHRRSGQRLLEGHALACLGDLHADAADLERARERYGESLAIRRELGDRRGEGWMLCRLGQMEARLGRRSAARDLAARSAELAREIGDDELTRECGAVV